MPELARRARTGAFYFAAFLIIAVGSIWLALQVAPMQTVSAAGQTARVGASLPALSLRGPGELDLFGQVMPTKPEFNGPIRPRLELTHITIDQQVVQMLRADGARKIELSLSQALAAGWTRYFVWETLVAAGFAVIPLVAFAAVRRKSVWKTIGAGVAVVCVVNVGGVLATAASTPQVLRSVKTLDDLVGVDPIAAAPQAASRPLPGVQAVVIGDSTASGAGLPLMPGASPLDSACGRSGESYASDLATVNRWTVLNLACNSATVDNGLLGVQLLGNGKVAPAQVVEAEQATHAKVIVVSVGADDVSWALMTRLCAASTVCNDKVSTAYFNKLLGQFTRSYYQLLGQLADLPWRPRILINEYYNPFGASLSCLSHYQVTPGKIKALQARLGQLNAVLGQGAQAFGFTAMQPRFTGHELCTPDPYVQGPGDPAPLHPTAAGQLAIALADQQTFAALLPSPAPTPSSSASTSPPSAAVAG